MSDGPGPSGTVTALEPFGPARNRVRVFVDGELRCELALELVSEAELRSGEAVEASTLRRLVDADEAWRAREAALRLLSYRARSRQEVRRRLSQKGFPSGIVERCVARLTEEELLDDEAFAGAYVRETLRLRPRGPFGMVRELQGKGVARELAERVVERVMGQEEVTEGALAREAAETWLGRQRPRQRPSLIAPPRDPDREKLRRRLYGYLSRRGFSSGATRDAMDHVEALVREELDEPPGGPG